MNSESKLRKSGERQLLIDFQCQIYRKGLECFPATGIDGSHYLTSVEKYTLGCTIGNSNCQTCVHLHSAVRDWMEKRWKVKKWNNMFRIVYKKCLDTGGEKSLLTCWWKNRPHL